MNKTMNEMLPHSFSAQSNMQPQAAHSATVSPVFSSIHYKLCLSKKQKLIFWSTYFSLDEIFIADIVLRFKAPEWERLY
jgi:hypothetical protein